MTLHYDDVARERKHILRVCMYMQRKLSLLPSLGHCFCPLRCRVVFLRGEQLRRLAVEIEVKHGRLALGAVVCAMAQQGILTVAA